MTRSRRRLRAWLCVVVCLLGWAGVASVNAATAKHSLRSWKIEGGRNGEAVTRVELLEARVTLQDAPEFAARDFEDSDWRSLRGWIGGLPARTGPFWVRLRLRVEGGEVPPENPALRIAVVCSYEMFLDGESIGHSGVVGDSQAREEAGLLDTLYTLPRGRFGPGEHVLAFRISSHYDSFPADHFALVLQFGSKPDLLRQQVWRAALPLLAACLAGIASLAAGVFAGLSREPRVARCFCALSAVVAVMELLNAWRWVSSYPYAWHYPRLLAISVLTHLASFLLLLALQWRFRGRFSKVVKWGLWPLVAIVWILPESYLERAWLLVLLHLAFCVATLFLAIREKKPGAGWALGGTLFGFFLVLFSGARFLEQGVFVVFALVVFVLCTDLATEMRRERRRRQEAVLESARLEAEFAKRYLQPHFLLNTLAVLQETIETTPHEASALIDALAQEFRQLGRMSGEQLVRLEDELALCRAHLEVMRHRTGQACAFTVRGTVDPRWQVPPAILHTLVENAFTHARDHGAAMLFVLGVEARDDRLCLHLEAPGSPRTEATRTSGTGQGTRYIQARLEESFAGQWTFESSSQGTDRWSTRIAFPLRFPF